MLLSRQSRSLEPGCYGRPMIVAIAGGHGKIGLRLTRLLAERGDSARGLIRNPDHADDVTEAGGEPVVLDLENADVGAVAEAVAGCDAVVFAAGAGPGSGAERKLTMDRDGAVLLAQAAKEAGVDRYLIVSSTGADPGHPGDEVFDVYLRAKGEADAAVAASGLDYTIVRPGHLTDDPGTGQVRIAESAQRGQVSRDDVAAVLAAALTEPATVGKTFELVSGENPIERALSALA
jgi:uncharacterized protein YbjT (DUF2867 family)